MDQSLFTRLAAWLRDGRATVLASVVATRGATPRKVGARMLVSARHESHSVGGGELEARVLAAARALLLDAREAETGAREVPGPAHVPPSGTLEIDLGGGADAAGICGGSMTLALRRWHGADDAARAVRIAADLAAGHAVALDARDLGTDVQQLARPDERLLIVGGGHCALALQELARPLGFETWVHDTRPECFAGHRHAGATQLCGGHELLRHALDTPRPVYGVLLSRDYASDVAALAVLAERPPAYLGMMGSRRRIAEVARALAARGIAAPAIEAPVGLELGAETPAEIAVSILARLVQRRREGI